MQWSAQDACSNPVSGPEAVPATIERIVRVSRVVSDLHRAESFYCAALGFTCIGYGPTDSRALAALGAPRDSAIEVQLRLGEEEISLVEFASSGRPYPADSRSDDLWFQHLAIVVRDMPSAYAALEGYAARHAAARNARPVWEAISRGGPQTLPPANGGVQAFKFRDPDGHPLELLWFPPGSGRALWHNRAASSGRSSPFLGIDHTAIAVSSTPRSLAFYHALGMQPHASTLNEGPAQSRLDGIDAAQVEVSPLRPASIEGPGIELLDYRPAGRRANSTITDLASDWIVAAASTPAPESAPRLVTDPDGHHLLLIDPSGNVRLGDR